MANTQPHFVVQRADLVRELSLVAGAVERKTTIPILSNIRIDAGSEDLIVTGTDLEIGLACRLPAEIKAAGSATLPAKRLLDYVRLLPDGPIEFKFWPNGWASINSGRSKTRIAGLDSACFPELPKPGPATVSIAASVLSRLIRQVAFAVSQEESRFTLRGALLEIADGKIRAVGTDGHRMALSEFPFDGTCRLLLPSKAMSELRRLIEASEGGATIGMSFDDNHIFVTIGSRLMIARKLTGNFPDYTRVLPKALNSTATLSTEELSAAIGRAMVSAEDRIFTLLLSIQPGELVVSSKSGETSEATESIPAEYDGAPIEIALNGRYLQDFLSVAGSEKVAISLNDSASAAQLSPVVEGEPSYRYIVMPIRK